MPESELIRVLVVDDSAFARKVIREILSGSPRIHVVDIARDGLEGGLSHRLSPGDRVRFEITYRNTGAQGVNNAVLIDDFDERWLLNQPPAVSEWERVLWERQGYQLEEQRKLVAVTLADGRRAAVPVDQVQVRYVGHDPL